MRDRSPNNWNGPHARRDTLLAVGCYLIALAAVAAFIGWMLS